jgi:hypothetical protein
VGRRDAKSNVNAFKAAGCGNGAHRYRELSRGALSNGAPKAEVGHGDAFLLAPKTSEAHGRCCVGVGNLMEQRLYLWRALEAHLGLQKR